MLRQLGCFTTFTLFLSAVSQAAVAQSSQSNEEDSWFYRPRADVGYTYFSAKLKNQQLIDPAPAAGTTNRNFTFASEKDFLATRGFGVVKYMEGTAGFTVGSGAWYGDFYYRQNLSGGTPKTINTTYGYDQATTAGVNTLAFSAQLERNFDRKQAAATIGRFLGGGWSVYGAYRWSQTERQYEKAPIGVRVTRPSTTTPGTPPVVTTSVITATQPQSNSLSIISKGPALGVGYSNPFGDRSQHVIGFGIGAAYSTARLSSADYSESTQGTLTTTSTPGSTTTSSVVIPFTSSIDSDTQHSFGVWGNVSYSYIATPQWTITTSADAYSFSYGTVQNSRARAIGKLRELSISGRIGASYLF